MLTTIIAPHLPVASPIQRRCANNGEKICNALAPLNPLPADGTTVV
ncbi:hypothetical protein [Nostoc sp.]